MRKLSLSNLALLIFVFCLFTRCVQADLQEGLIAYFPFNGNANDEAGNGHDGIVYGATLTTDRFGNTNSAYEFDGIVNNLDFGMIADYWLESSLATD